MSKENTTHKARMQRQADKRPWGADGMAPTRDDLAVPRGTARNLRRKHLQVAYAKRAALGL